MDPFTAMLLGTALNQGISYLQGRQQQRISAREDTKSLINQYNESVRQQGVQENLFTGTMSRSYGGNFLDALKGGKTVDQLMDTGFGKDTAIGKQMQLMRDNANLAVNNSVRQNQQVGVMANMQGRQNLNQSLVQEIQAQQASGAAAASQATSGIRSDRGTGDNAVTMQEQQNQLAREQLSQQIAMQNQQTMFSLENTQVSALQQADQIRKEMEIDKLSAIENALNAYDQHIADMREYDVTQESLKSDAKDRNEEAVGLWGMNDERVDVEDKLDGDDVDYREVELSFEDDE
jgi:hypothetical protein